ncbi:MAG TPA: Ku protein [Paracoccaceae bacterium]|nr:Ku protein [Paracoccaceae bacterium]
MAPRPYWKGYLKLSLVTARVSLTPATSDQGKFRFHTLNQSTGNRVRSRYVDAETGAVIADEDEVRGYEVENGRHVIIEDEEIEATGLESTHTIDISQFVPSDSIGWIWYDTPYFLKPEEDVAEEAFAVIREAMEVTGTVGISRLVLARRERAILLEPQGKGIILWTLRYGDEVRNAADLVESTRDGKPDRRLLELIRKLIGGMTAPWDPEMVRDPVQEKLKEIIAIKAKAKPRRKKKPEPGNAPEPESVESNVIDMMEALRRSIEKEKKGRNKSNETGRK